MSVVYDVGGITVINGDVRDVLPGIPSCDMVMTDPPYGHNNNNDGDLIHNWEKAFGRIISEDGNDDARPIAGDSPEESHELVCLIFAHAARMLPPGGACCCCCGGGGPDPQFARWSLLLDKYIPFKQMIVWDKGPMGMGWHYRRSYETILVGQMKGKAKWYGDRRVENIIRPKSIPGVKKIIPRKHEHPTPKPVALMRHFIELHTAPGDLVVDPFCGGGSTLIAAAECGRRAIGIEVSRKYCDMAVERLTRINGPMG